MFYVLESGLWVFLGVIKNIFILRLYKEKI